jgi:pimeloyl-ACP methyl ester carboxylesterase
MSYVEPIIGRYVHVELDGLVYRTSFEEAGEGIPLVCLHTAGGDLRQYRHLLNDPEITSRFRVIAFDMPRHGRSLPPDGTYDDEYVMTRKYYLDFIDAFTEALALDRPALLGTSMGGYIMLSVAIERPERYRALVAVQPRAYAGNWPKLDFLLDNPDINIHSFTTVIKALISPDSPLDRSREVEWVYAQAGPGVLAGDLAGAHDCDVRDTIAHIDAQHAGLFVIGGDWDLSCLPAHTQELADAIPGLPVVRMPDAGHFPPAEHPDAFRKVLLPILDQIEQWA